MPVWNESWISPADHPDGDLGVFAFRNVLKLPNKPDHRLVKVSADNRYKLYVNGVMVAFGPQRGTAQHWFYDEIDLAPYLKPGENEIIALVWNFGWLAPMAQHSVRTGFLCAGDGVETPGNWEIARLDGWRFDTMHSEKERFYIDVGPGEIIEPFSMPSPNSTLRVPDWTQPNVIGRAEEFPPSDGGVPWAMVPRSIPPMRYQVRSEQPVFRRGFLGDNAGDPAADSDFGDLRGFEEGREFSEIVLKSGARVLLDYGQLLCAYPRLVVRSPVEGARVALKLTYAESMWNEDGSKGNRNEVGGKKIKGYQDKLIVGPETSVYEPLWWRTYRYLMIEVENDAENPDSKTQNPIVIQSLDAIETGYPYEIQSSFKADDPSVAKLWEVSVRTAERCAG
ncbi:MAG TPA: hypothetical protein VMI31_18310, partial [Fimbriimonadaceae bacterium]|nr:hypothetical protein [Fimbriimonadaceae bacterium]